MDEVDPVQIILFGSQARGEGHEDSDLDFLLVQDPPFTGEKCSPKADGKALDKICPYAYFTKFFDLCP